MALRCHYVVLGVERTATDDELKKAYRKQALLWHPDRNLDSREEAEARFKELQGAHAVLIDPHERSWYDQHRDAILRGGSGVAGDAAAEESADPASHLWFYFTAAAYSGYLARLDYQCSHATSATTNVLSHSHTHSLTSHYLLLQVRGRPEELLHCVRAALRGARRRGVRCHPRPRGVARLRQLRRAMGRGARVLCDVGDLRHQPQLCTVR